MEGDWLKSRATKVMRGSVVGRESGEREVTIMEDQRSEFVVAVRWETSAEPVIPFAPVMRATLGEKVDAMAIELGQMCEVWSGDVLASLAFLIWLGVA